MPTNDAVPAPSPPSKPPPAPSENSAPRIIIAPTVIVPVVVAVPVPVPAASSSENENLSSGNVPLSSEGKTESAGALPEFPRASPPGAFSAFWKKFGGAGFVASSLFHFALIVGALLFVVAEVDVPAEKAAAFVSGSGGGASGTRGADRSRAEKLFRRGPREIRAPKIVSRAADAKIALPEMPEIRFAGALGFSGKLGGNAASASGGGKGGGASGRSGFGGGIGAGTGVGIGGGGNHLGKFKVLLGTKVHARRIAVFLDCSGSMKKHLPAVKAEIYEKFPDADVFAYSGAGIEARDGEIVGARTMRAKDVAAIGRRKKADDATEASRLSGRGKTVYGRYAAHFSAGVLGAWLDVFLRERYDALVVFSDFRDGIRQRRDGKTVFADSSYAPADDARTPRERRWEADWLAAFARSGAPKLYLFSVRATPQDFLKKCVEASGGEVSVLDL